MSSKIQSLTNSVLTLQIIIFFSNPFSAYAQGYNRSWMAGGWNTDNIATRISVPNGYTREITKYGTFQDWLRHLPIKKGKPPVRLFNGHLKRNQKAHFAVIDIDVGNEDLQQCADAVIRLRAEYLYCMDAYDSIHFKFTNGDNAKFRDWIMGKRPEVGRSVLHWINCEKTDSTYASFRGYLNSVFMYAGTYSLSHELHPVANINDLEIGDVFIHGGFPGHAVIVVDLAINISNNSKIFLLAQSYMPAQEIHILNNPNDRDLSPWYNLNFGDTLHTPEWVFDKSESMRF